MNQFLVVIWIFLCAAAGIGPWMAWREGYDAGRRRERRENRENRNADGMGYHGRAFVRELTKIMDVQADGGDSPEAYVAWAVKEAEKIARSKP